MDCPQFCWQVLTVVRKHAVHRGKVPVNAQVLSFQVLTGDVRLVKFLSNTCLFLEVDDEGRRGGF